MTITKTHLRNPSAAELFATAQRLSDLLLGDDSHHVKIEVRPDDQTDLITVLVESDPSEHDDNPWSTAQASIVSQWNGETGIFDVKTRTWGIRNAWPTTAWGEAAQLQDRVRAVVDALLSRDLTKI